jgi:hypothetical protein
MLASHIPPPFLALNHAFDLLFQRHPVRRVPGQHLLQLGRIERADRLFQHLCQLEVCADLLEHAMDEGPAHAL